MRTVGRLWVALAVVVAAVVGGAFWLSSLDSTVTRWRVPYQVSYAGQTFPLYDRKHYFAQADLQRKEQLTREGTASGLPRFVPPGREVEVVYVQPHGYRCLMRYLSLSNVG